MYQKENLTMNGFQNRISSDINILGNVLRRWKRMLNDYRKLDRKRVNSDFSLLSRIIRSSDYSRKFKNMVSLCRDNALRVNDNVDDLLDSVENLLITISELKKDENLEKVRKFYADQGMSKRYRPLTRRLSRERLYHNGKELIYTDFRTDDPSTTRRVRRIIEKRAAQAVHKLCKSSDKETNSFRQKVRRAASFSLYRNIFIEYDKSKRFNGTHWKEVVKGKETLLKSKKGYNSEEEALEVCRIHNMASLDSPRKMTAYRCSYCGKWHVGHSH